MRLRAHRFVNRLKKICSGNRIGLSLLAATWVIFFSRLLSGKYVYFLDDLQAIYYPMEHVYAQFQHAFALPVWSNYFGFGHPLIAWGQLGFFTPVHLLLRALFISPLNLLQISVVTYFAIGLLGMYIFLRKNKLDQLAAAFGSIVFTFSGFNIGHLNHVNFYTGVMILPWLLLAIWAFLLNPTLRRAIYVSLAGAAMTLSAQPQVVFYCFIAAVIYALALLTNVFRRQKNTYFLKLVPFSIVAIILALGLSSFAIVPLREFLPLTERGDSLPEAELFDFSYPPYHSVTLIAPYFFGDHETYWGPKGFQELAAFVGIIPLLLTGVAVANWKTNRSLRIVAIILVVLGPILAMGIYSPIYRYIIEHKILTLFSIPGRFVLFFDLGVAILAALAIHDIKDLTQLPFRQKLLKAYVPALIVLAIILLPFAVYAIRTPLSLTQQLTDTRLWVAVILFLTGIITFIVSTWFKKWNYVLVTCAIITLLIFAWDYNPLTLRAHAFLESPFANTLIDYEQRTSIPARLYSRDSLLNTEQERSLIPTSVLSPSFTFIQPIKFDSTKPCLQTKFFSRSDINGQINVSLSESLYSPEVENVTLTSNQLRGHEVQRLCWETSVSTDKTYYVLFTSDGNSGINLYTVLDSTNPAYWIRKSNPTMKDLELSLKPMRLVILSDTASPISTPSLLLARHVQATANTSSARWIGSLSIRSYREFIEMFFANDRDSVVDGEGVHMLKKHRNLFNMSGVTYFIQQLGPGVNDSMPENNFIFEQEYVWEKNMARLYRNPEAFPKAFLVDNARYMPASDDQRAVMVEKDFDPKKIVLINGTTPPQKISDESNTYAVGTADIKYYSNTKVEISVNTPNDTWLVLSDTSTPEWHTLIDGKSAPYYTAYSMFRAAQVPAGKHTVSFVYKSPAIETSKKITVATLAVTLLLLIASFGRKFLSWAKFE